MNERNQLPFDFLCRHERYLCACVGVWCLFYFASFVWRFQWFSVFIYFLFLLFLRSFENKNTCNSRTAALMNRIFVHLWRLVPRFVITYLKSLSFLIIAKMKIFNYIYQIDWEISTNSNGFIDLLTVFSFLFVSKYQQNHNRKLNRLMLRIVKRENTKGNFKPYVFFYFSVICNCMRVHMKIIILRTCISTSCAT